MPEGDSGIRLGEDHDWPDFDASVTGSRYARCQRSCFVDARRFEQVKAAKLLFGLRKGPSVVRVLLSRTRTVLAVAVGCNAWPALMADAFFLPKAPYSANSDSENPLAKRVSSS